ncbi:MAG: metallophosphoesterase [Proteobacteria bacterium]|nr:metallophosphoesterase [Pseudomonadota bacterium]
MSLTYVIPDIHGRFDLLSEALHRIHARAAGNGGTLVLLGDYVDKGPHSNMVIARLRRGMPSGWTFIALKGNHDAMMAAGLRDPAKMTHWCERGGDTAVASYGGDGSLVPEADIAWIEALPLTHIDAHRVYVHAGLDCGVGLEAQPEATLLWKRYPKGDAAGFDGRHIVHGHNAFARGPELYDGRTNLDTQAWRTGRLVTGVFEDAASGGPVDFIVVQGPRQDR